MFHNVAVRSLFHGINSLIRCEIKQYESFVTAIPGLSLNNNSLNQRKSVRRLLGNSPLKEKKLVVRHDVVNNALSSHRTNNYRPACDEELTNYLKSKRQQIFSIVFCRRVGTSDLFSQLLGTGVLITLQEKLKQPGAAQRTFEADPEC